MPLLFAVACSAAPSGTAERVGASSSAIINGQGSPAAQNFAVLLEHDLSCNSTGCSVVECTGSLVAPNLVLTARHCVSNTQDGAFTCDASGHGSAGGAIGADFPPATIGVYVGTMRNLDVSTPDAVGAQLFHDSSPNLCDHDVALVGLDHALAGVPVASIRLDEPPASGDLVTAVGWGATTTENSPLIRQQRSGIEIRHLGPFTSPSGNDVPPNEFDVGEAICEGDSGSPALDGTGAVVGVASRGGNSLTVNPSDLGASCVGSQTTNYYSQAYAFRDLIDQAFTAMGQKPQLASGGSFGDACSGPTECASGVCVGSSGKGTCSQQCASSASCPNGYSCQGAGSQEVCQQSGSSGGGCSVGAPASPERSSRLACALLAVAALCATGARRARSRSRPGRSRSCPACSGPRTAR